MQCHAISDAKLKVFSTSLLALLSATNTRSSKPWNTCHSALYTIPASKKKLSTFQQVYVQCLNRPENSKQAEITSFTKLFVPGTSSCDVKRGEKKQQHTKFSISTKNGQKRAESKRVNSVTQSRQRDPGERQKNKSSASLGRGKQDNGDAAATPQLCAQLSKQRQREERRETNRVTRRRPLPLSEVPPLWTPGPWSAAPGARPVIFFSTRDFFFHWKNLKLSIRKRFSHRWEIWVFHQKYLKSGCFASWKRLKLFVCLSVH